jgi:hypothetical protein
LGASSAIGAPNEWAYIEVKAKVNSATGSIEIRNYGTTILNLTGINTQNGANAFIDKVYLGHATQWGVFYFDDYYILDTTGTTNNGFLATTSATPRVIGLTTTGAGDTTQFTPSSGANYAAAASLDVSTPYVASATVGNRDLYNLTDVPAGITNVKGLVVSARAYKSDAGTRKMALGVKSGGTVYDSGDTTLTNAFVTSRWVYETDPATGVPWTESGLNALQLGPKVSA